MYTLLFLLWTGIFYEAPPLPDVLPPLESFAADEREVILDFMNVTDETGISNSQKLAERRSRYKVKKSFQAHPMHWPGITWDKEKKDGIYRVVQIVWDDADLSGTLDLRAFFSLRFLFIFKHDVSGGGLSKYTAGGVTEPFRLHLPENSSLEVLVCDGAGLSSLELDGQKQLRHLSCERNPIRNFDLSQLSKLEFFSCWDCPAENVRFPSTKPKLQSLSLSGTCCPPETVYGMKKIKRFGWCTKSVLPADFPAYLASCTELEFQDISSPALDFFKNRCLVFLTLTSLPSLTVLDLRDSEKLEYLEITDCPKLRRIILPASLRPDLCSEDEAPLCTVLENIPTEEVEFSDGTVLSLKEFLGEEVELE